VCVRKKKREERKREQGGGVNLFWRWSNFRERGRERKKLQSQKFDLKRIKVCYFVDNEEVGIKRSISPTIIK
jgi:hypothetical protein